MALDRNRMREINLAAREARECLQSAVWWRSDADAVPIRGNSERLLALSKARRALEKLEQILTDEVLLLPPVS